MMALPPECPSAHTRRTKLADACDEADNWHAQFHLVIKQRDDLRGGMSKILALLEYSDDQMDVRAAIAEIAKRDPVRA